MSLMFFCASHPKHPNFWTSYWKSLNCPEDLPVHPFIHFQFGVGYVPQWCTIQHARKANGLIKPQGSKWMSTAKSGAEAVEGKEGGLTSACLKDSSGYSALC